MFTVVMLVVVAVTSMVIQLVVMVVLLLKAIIKIIRYTVSSITQQIQATLRLTTGSSSALTVTEQRLDNAVKHVDALEVSGNAHWLPVAADLITTAAYAVVRVSPQPVNITIADSITVDTMQSIMRHTNIKHLHLQLGNVTPDVIKAFSHMVIQQSLVRKCVSSCTIDNFERLDAATVKILLQNMPASLHTLTIRQAQSCRFVQGQCDIVYCPRSVKTLNITHIGFRIDLPEGLEKLYTIDCSMLAWDTIPSTLLELHTTNMRFALPALPLGLLKLQMHSANRMTMNIPLENIPTTVTHLKLAETQTIKVPEWPPNLQVLDVGAHYLHRLDDLPDTITELYIKLSRKVQPRYKLETVPPLLKVLDVCNLEFAANVVLPESLEVLRQDTSWGPLPALPNGLKELKLAGFRCNELPAVLPAALEILHVGLCYLMNSVLDNSVLPASLHTLYVFEHYKHSLEQLRSSIQVHRVTPRFDPWYMEMW
jgi:hypothetical protein